MYGREGWQEGPYRRRVALQRRSKCLQPRVGWPFRVGRPPAVPYRITRPPAQSQKNTQESQTGNKNQGHAVPCRVTQKVDVRLPGKENSNYLGARPVRLIITMIERIRTSMLSIKNSLTRSPAHRTSQQIMRGVSQSPLSRKCGKYEAGNARVWPLRWGECPQNLSIYSFLAWTRHSTGTPPTLPYLGRKLLSLLYYSRA